MIVANHRSPIDSAVLLCLFGGQRSSRAKAFASSTWCEDPNKRPVYALTFEFTVPRETDLFGYRVASAEAQTHRITHKTIDTAELEDESEEPLLYDPAKPSCAYPLDGLPSGVGVGPDGQIDASSARRWPIVLPLLVTLGWGLFVLGVLEKLR
ncbi:MAG TPA: hypothetical protein PLJ27_19660 [Polyangiaceae bacterium]|jgi:hypothetical protein|nr:MAG: hypothetical protein BWY17_03401 [Deltaproteobacteria bacterium ADurb.Bin207]HNZ24911.1 hypothetical protein [Polyangiaceae bacterium]HOE50500.1 hypothetical protein [Polyangiaceae bacterium]HOH03046.1 hypothetical protein [Polyangiaceae bacterium]HOR37309.1 hypothetical protein [Polyangiaceae bacterium]